MRSLRADDPQHIGDYRLLGLLGEGGMGSVYLAQSPLGRTVAVKLVRRDLAEHAEFRDRFEHEVRAARRVGGAWTAPVLDADTGADRPWVATGYLPGITLSEAVAGRATPLPARTLRILANRLCRALGAVHEAGLIHRDVKPSNILVTIDGPRVIDFGIARALETVTADAHLTRTGAVVGSPGFMSPEQVRGDRLTEASDIFSLGSVLAFAATGHTPFGGTGVAGHVQMYRITQEEPDLEGVPEPLRAVVAACLAKEPDQRPTPDQLLERTADPDGEPGPGAGGHDTAEPWLPATLVAQLGRHAAQLLDMEAPGARVAAARAAEAPALTPPAPARDAGRDTGACEVPPSAGGPDPAAQPGTGSDSAASAAGSDAKPGAGAGSDAKADADPGSATGSGSVTGSDRVTGSGRATGSDRVTGSGSVTGSDSATGSDAVMESGSVTESGSVPGSGSVTVSVPVTGSGSVTESGAAVEAGKDAEAGPDAGPGAAGAGGRAAGPADASTTGGAPAQGQGPPAPAPPGGPPENGVPGMHGMMTVTGPFQGTPPSGQWAQRGGGPYAPQAPHPGYGEPVAPRRSGGRGVLFGALGVVLAVVAGAGTFVALRVLDGGGEDGKRAGSGATPSPGAEGRGTGEEKPSPEDI
ncbi:protein kinase, partial [Streptomyces sp. PU-14G]|uniref:serine/threonine-protein kinase n=1 Tax=Streptomyces sp. PU-14G TaxID=2800808 RepID=UPI0034DF9189